jgi:acyl carrier protein
MSKDEILGRVQAAMSELFEIDPSDITPDSHLIDDLDLDSIDAIDMAARLQEITGRRVPEDALKAIRTIGDVVDLVHAELAQRASDGGGGGEAMKRLA